MKGKYMKITPKMLEGAYNLKVDLKDTIPYQEHYIEYEGKKFRCTKLGNEEWKTQEISDFPFYKLPKDFNLLTKDQE